MVTLHDTISESKEPKLLEEVWVAFRTKQRKIFVRKHIQNYNYVNSCNQYQSP